nr:unnamed protein product [Callosobruchus chinensis]
MEKKGSSSPNIKPPGEADTDLIQVVSPPQTLEENQSQSSGLSSYSSLFAKLFTKSSSKEDKKEPEKKESKVPSVPEAPDEAMAEHAQESVIVKAFGKIGEAKGSTEIPVDLNDITEEHPSLTMLGEDNSVESLE